MKLKFKQQTFQSHAVEAVADCFLGQPKDTGVSYRIDPGRGDNQALLSIGEAGFKNSDLAIPLGQVLANVHAVQLHQNLPLSTELKASAGCDINLDIEMETGTGKTYCYIKSMFELNKRYGWGKFIVVVPSIAIREGVHKSLEITAEHFLEQYGKRARFFIYNSKQLHNLESFSSDAGVNVMVINVQAFNARGQDARRIYEELDDFQSRRPIDVISRNRPIVILDEPQKMEGAKTMDSLKEFTPLMILRYSATHRQEHTKIYRLDALDAYNQKLVKKIAVRGITVRGLAGTNAYLYLEAINVSTSKPPEARAELEIQQVSGIKRVVRKLGKSDNLYDLSDGLEQYRGFVVSDINALDNTVSFTNGVVLQSGEATGDVNEAALRRIQIREAVKAHFDKEQTLFHQGIKVLSLFFIDEVAKYRGYTDAGEEAGDYARIFEEEYLTQLNEVLTLEDTPYNRYLKGIQPAKTHNGYFSIDKKTKRLINPEAKARGESAGETDDVDAYDLIGKIAEDTQLTRSTISQILQEMNIAVFGQYKVNPEDFILKTSRIVNEQKATVIVEHLAYNPVEATHTLDIFTQEKPKEDFTKAIKTDRHIYDYVFTDSKNERDFVKDLDTGTEVVVYAKLPRSFFIPTPVGSYNPDWAIAFKQGEVKHVYFIAETKGSMSSMELRKIEECKIDCARKFFTKITSDQVKYDIVDSYSKLMELVR